MIYGLSDETITRLKEVLAHFPQVDKAILYGSRAKGTHRHGSDIDLTLIGDELTQLQLAQIDEAIDDLLLPYQVDLSLWDDLKHPALLEHIQQFGVILYQRELAARHALPA